MPLYDCFVAKNCVLTIRNFNALEGPYYVDQILEWDITPLKPSKRKIAPVFGQF